MNQNIIKIVGKINKFFQRFFKWQACTIKAKYNCKFRLYTFVASLL